MSVCERIKVSVCICLGYTLTGVSECNAMNMLYRCVEYTAWRESIYSKCGGRRGDRYLLSIYYSRVYGSKQRKVLRRGYRECALLCVGLFACIKSYWF